MLSAHAVYAHGCSPSGSVQIFMIQHHRGALEMVDTLFKTPGAAQDEIVFKFANDVHADQTTEIDRMQQMLDALPPQPGGLEPSRQ